MVCKHNDKDFIYSNQSWRTEHSPTDEWHRPVPPRPDPIVVVSKQTPERLIAKSLMCQVKEPFCRWWWWCRLFSTVLIILMEICQKAFPIWKSHFCKPWINSKCMFPAVNTNEWASVPVHKENLRNIIHTIQSSALSSFMDDSVDECVGGEIWFNKLKMEVAVECYLAHTNSLDMSAMVF